MTPRTWNARLAIVVSLSAVAISVVVAQMEVRQAPARDSRVAATGPGEIAGTLLTEGENPQPVRRAEVRAFAQGGAPRTVYTDAQGRFAFRQLPLGRYSVEANKAGFVRAAYGARRYDRAGTPVTVSDTSRTVTIDMRMARGAVIAGRLVDEFGQPAQGARITIQAVRTVNGERTYVPVPMVTAILGEVADDRGMYRLFGLPAGDYVISATPRSVGAGDIRRMTDAEIQAARQALAQTPGAGTPGEPPPPMTLGFSQVYYPGVLSQADAGIITVTAGEERVSVDFAVTLVRTAVISGTVVTPGGVAPESVQLMLTPRGGGSTVVGGGGGGQTMVFTTTVAGGANRRVNADGTFSYGGVTPGAYTMQARASGPDGAALWAAADVTVDGSPVSGVSLVLQDGLTVSGTIAVDADGVDPPDNYSRARVLMVPQSGAMMTVALRAGGAAPGGPTVSPDGKFSVPGLTPGRYQVFGNFSTPEANWTMKSAIVKGKDALDVPFDLAANDAITDAVITFTNRTQDVSGTLADGSGRPAPDYTIIIFPEDRALWASSRRIRTARPGTDGRYTIANLPAGAYRIAALTDIGPEETRDRALLEELLASSIAFTLADGQKKTQDLQIR